MWDWMVLSKSQFLFTNNLFKKNSIKRSCFKQVIFLIKQGAKITAQLPYYMVDNCSGLWLFFIRMVGSFSLICHVSNDENFE